MKQVQQIMGMPVTVEIADSNHDKKLFQIVFDYFRHVDNLFSTYKETSEISLLNKKKVTQDQLSPEVKKIFRLAEDTNIETNGYFNIRTKNGIDPSGIVKGWAIYNAAELLRKHASKNFFIDAGGDIEVAGVNAQKKPWTVGICNPFEPQKIVKILSISNRGIATSGTYNRGNHVYNPHNKNKPATDIASITVIGPNVYDADRFATAAFAMGEKGISFIDALEGCEGYAINNKGIATYTQGFQQFIFSS